MDQYKQFLAAQVINEGHIVNYRLLSRSLKVHTDQAKRMLYDFHQKQNAKKSGAVHATYVVRGTKKQGPLQNVGADIDMEDLNGSKQIGTDADGDSFMVSSPAQSFLPDFSQKTVADDEDLEVVSTQCSTLCKEENLSRVKGQYSEITSIFVYSLGPNPLNDIHILSECNRQVVANFSSEDPLKTWKQFGIIQNPHTKRRTGKPSMPATIAPVAPVTTKTNAPTGTVSKPIKAEAEPKEKPQAEETKLSTTASKRTPASQAKATSKMVRRESSDLFKAFAKGKQAKSKPQPSQGSQSSVADSPAASQSEDAEMDDPPIKPTTGRSKLQEAAAESSDEDDSLIAVTKNSEKGDAARKAREARQAKLKALMDDEDDEVTPNATANTKENTQPSDDEAEDVMQVDEGALDAKSQPEPDSQEATTVSGGRRRGRRKVMKKKTTQDEEGYLVTTEEPVWESFSEDEPEAKKLKPSASTFGNSAKPSKKAATKGQGNIMSFFGKK